MKTTKVFETLDMPESVMQLIHEISHGGNGVMKYPIGYFVADDADDSDTALFLDDWLQDRGAEWGEVVIISIGTWHAKWEEFDPKLAKRAKRAKRG